VFRHFVMTAALIATASTAAMANPPAPPWQSGELREHPLVGQFVDARTQATLTAEEVLARAAAARFLIVGERHDNPDHHALQAWVTEHMAEQGRRPAIVYEMFEENEQTAIDAWRAAGPTDASSLGSAVKWEDSGWPAWSFYQPMADTALTHDLPLLAGNIALETARTLAREGLGSLPGDLSTRLDLTVADIPAIHDAMTRDVDEGHCNLMPDSAIAPMVMVQRARDAQMAATMIAGLNTAQSDQALLIAGNGHARADRGVPYRLEQKGVPRSDILVIAPLEVREGAVTVTDYAEAEDAPAESLPFDVLWFTPRVDSVDHCAELRKRMEDKTK
jgi:uncharacterized iron-regulated protein